MLVEAMIFRGKNGVTHEFWDLVQLEGSAAFLADAEQNLTVSAKYSSRGGAHPTVDSLLQIDHCVLCIAMRVEQKEP